MKTRKQIEKTLSLWMLQHGTLILRVSIGIIFFWFGVLKFIPDISPSQDLAIRTITVLTFGYIPSKAIILTLAVWEVLIGVGFITGRFMKASLVLLFTQMTGTFSPIILFPNEVFTTFPLVPTLEGQYILKNIIIVSAAIIIGGQALKPIQQSQQSKRPKLLTGGH